MRDIKIQQYNLKGQLPLVSRGSLKSALRWGTQCYSYLQLAWY